MSLFFLARKSGVKLRMSVLLVLHRDCFNLF
jgi:hypothetical protein